MSSSVCDAKFDRRKLTVICSIHTVFWRSGGRRTVRNISELRQPIIPARVFVFLRHLNFRNIAMCN